MNGLLLFRLVNAALDWLFENAVLRSVKRVSRRSSPPNMRVASATAHEGKGRKGEMRKTEFLQSVGIGPELVTNHAQPALLRLGHSSLPRSQASKPAPSSSAFCSEGSGKTILPSSSIVIHSRVVGSIRSLMSSASKRRVSCFFSWVWP